MDLREKASIGRHNPAMECIEYMAATNIDNCRDYKIRGAQAVTENAVLMVMQIVRSQPEWAMRVLAMIEAASGFDTPIHRAHLDRAARQLAEKFPGREPEELDAEDAAWVASWRR